MSPSPVERRARTLLTVAIFVLVAMLIVLGYSFMRIVTPPSSPTKPAELNGLAWVRTIYGFGPAADQQLATPTSVAFGPDGSIYATDPRRGRVFVFGADGSFKRLIHTGPPAVGRGLLKRPESIALDSSGDLYVADSGANKIIVFGPNGAFLREWPTATQARGVAVHGDSVYVLEVGSVGVFDTLGKPLAQFGTRGAAPGQIDAYQGIASDGNRIFIADAFNRRVQAFDVNGNLLWAYPTTVKRGGPAQALKSQNTSATPFDLPQDITIDGRGRLVVADAFNFSLMVLDPANGHVLGTYGEMGNDDGQFYYPSGIAYDPGTNRFAVADTNNNRVQIIELPGSGALVSPKRIMASPWRYLLPAIALGVVILVAFGWWLWRYLRRRKLQQLAAAGAA